MSILNGSPGAFSLFRDKEYFSALLRIGAPITIQNFLMSSLNMVGVLMIGQLGETEVAAVGLANQLFFLLSLLLFGISSGAALFTAQFWGKKDVASIHKVMGIALALGLAFSSLFTITALFFPEKFLSFYSTDPQVLLLGSQYLRIIGASYFATSISYSFAGVLRSTENARLPMLVSISALLVNMVLNYALIFGRLGMPRMGVQGAAAATLAARILECGVLVLATYRLRSPVAAPFSRLIRFDASFLRRYFSVALPVVFNETFWALGITVYNAIYARIGTDSIAAVNISATVESMAFVLFIGIANASAVIIGGRIGAGEEHKASVYARRTLALGAALAVLVGLLLFASKDLILSLYNVSDFTLLNARNILTIMSFALWVRVANMIVVVGVLRSGGDTRFSFFLDVGSVWLVGVPLAAAGAFLLHLPVYGVVLMVMGDEVAKFSVGLWRVFSGKWINNLTRSAQPAEISS